MQYTLASMILHKTHIDHYRIDSLLSQNEHAAVYGVTDTTQPSNSENTLPCTHALKVAQSAIGAKRLRHEITMYERFIESPFVIDCAGHGETDSMPYYVMPHYERTLHNIIADNARPLTMEKSLAVFSALVAAVDDIHQQGIAHGDLHPRNILFNGESCVLIDFANAHALNTSNALSIKPSTTNPNSAIYAWQATPLYSGRNQLFGLSAPSIQSDVYALCSIYCALISGIDHSDLFSQAYMQSLANLDNTSAQQSLQATIQQAHDIWLNSKALANYASLKGVLLKGLSYFMHHGNVMHHSNHNSNHKGNHNRNKVGHESAHALLKEIQASLNGAHSTQEQVIADANATIAFQHDTQFSEQIYALKQEIEQHLRRGVAIDDEALLSLAKRYELEEKLDAPVQALWSLVQEIENNVEQEPEFRAFSTWSQRLLHYKDKYSAHLTKSDAKRFIQQGLNNGAGSEERLRAWLGEQFILESGFAKHKFAQYKVAATVFASVAMILIYFVFVRGAPQELSDAESLSISKNNPSTSFSSNGFSSEEGASDRKISENRLSENRPSAPRQFPSINGEQAASDMLETANEQGISNNVDATHLSDKLSEKLSDKQNANRIEYTLLDSATQQNYTIVLNKVAMTQAPISQAPISREVKPQLPLLTADQSARGDANKQISKQEFYVMSEEISQGLWLACVNAGRCRQTKSITTNEKRRAMLEPNRPVVNVSWYDIQEDFIPFISEALGTELFLPTMAEWLGFAYSVEGETLLPTQIHCKGCQHPYMQYSESTMPVNLLPQGPFGLRNVFGNVQEWLQDCWQDVKLKRERCDQAPAVGGSWMNDKQMIEQAPLSRLLKTARSTTTGFRLVKRDTAD